MTTFMVATVDIYGMLESVKSASFEFHVRLTPNLVFPGTCAVVQRQVVHHYRQMAPSDVWQRSLAWVQ